MMPDGRVRQTSHINQVLLIGGENCIERFGCRGNGLWYPAFATQKTLQASHRGRDPSRTMAKEQLALPQLLGCQSGETAWSPTTEISFDCCASKDVALASKNRYPRWIIQSSKSSKIPPNNGRERWSAYAFGRS